MPQHRTLALFPQAPDNATTSDTPLRPRAPAVARLLMPNRTQIDLRAVDLESLLPEGHRARVVWAYGSRPTSAGFTPASRPSRAVTLKRVAQDGMRVRASAGAASFRRRGTLEQHLADARAQVAALKRQIEADPVALSRRQHAARVRAAREREDRVHQALSRMPELEHIKAQQGKRPESARGSTTDAAATAMKMGDGGFRPTYNAQSATDTESQVIERVEVVTVGSDLGQLAPMVEQVTARHAQTPDEWLVDGGYPAHRQMRQRASAQPALAAGVRPQPRKSPKRAPVTRPGPQPDAHLGVAARGPRASPDFHERGRQNRINAL